MANPFQEKFLKAGLVSKKQVGKAKVEQRKKEKARRRNKGRTETDKTVERLRQRQKEQVLQSNALRDQAAREREVAAQVRQLVAGNRLKLKNGDLVFHFPDLKKIKKMYLPKEIVNKLSNGKLGIVKVGDQYEVVPAETAEKVRERLPEALLVLNEPQTFSPDDPYAEFTIPDDYEW